MKIPLLVTSAVNVSATCVEITDAKERVELTLEAIREWTRIVPDIDIVICDGSGYNFEPDVAQAFPDSSIECLHFRNNKEMVMSRGKGFGEGEIVAHAVSHSRFVRSYDCFAKCTAKLWVENFTECLGGFNGVFNCDKAFGDRSLDNYSHCDTRFYITEKRFYCETLSMCHTLVKHYQGYHLEHAFGDVLRKAGTKHIVFKTKPLIYGYSGSTGEFYSPEPERMRSRLLRRIRNLIA
jgi:hypothetical protein